MFTAEKEMVIETGKKLDRYGLIALSGGNVSWRMDSGEILVTPSGMIYEDLTPEDIIVMDIDGNILESKRRPSVDTIALLYIFQKRPDIKGIIHTHQPYATALGLIEDEIPCNLTTLANAARGDVKVAPYSSAASLDMGVKAVDYLGEQLAVVLKHHGVIGVGDSLKQALYSCVYLEEACKTIVAARSCGRELAMMNQEQIREAVDVFKNYGQK
ncbi:class II aldolase/adducin family protein [Enterococcus sp. 669A]|uniref:Class II aldolase/adducin family protein n=1 Tax=Candidatus Enterococcus moelleringii TaxID=2815325 RepID=A0ABS3L9Q9_9ENTE|nr:class II aldolase/adducin family protein [Enterococcus sp. 669A]MBO1306356.1 class II aldolase/adducin family protein [Enterococcus sp. 669A]